MNIVIASDSYKETLSSKEVSTTISSAFKKVFDNSSFSLIPLADGGEGTVDALIDATNGQIIKTVVLDPLQREIESFYGVLGDNKTAIIEMASASGIELLTQEEKNPMKTTSYGFGQLIKHALDNGIRNFILGLGGSATNDAGIGMLQALGVKFYDKEKNELDIVKAKNIDKIHSFDDRSLAMYENLNIEVACDVKNPLCGKNGASFVFAQQKGADASMIKELDKKLFDFANICESFYKIETKNIEGCGAAGGLGFALVTFFNAQLKSGIDIVMEKVNLEEFIKDADLVITGEGKIDSQTINGKTPIGVARLAKKYNKKVIAIAGCTSNDYEIVYNYGIDAVFDCTPISMSFDTVKKEAKRNLELTAYNVAVLLKMQLKA